MGRAKAKAEPAPKVTQAAFTGLVLAEIAILDRHPLEHNFSIANTWLAK